jgi:hypothetical protein
MSIRRARDERDIYHIRVTYDILQMQQLNVCFLLVYLTCFVNQIDSSVNVHVSNSVIVDDAGRIRVYHGVNFVMKGFPWYPQELLDRSNVASLAQCGINFVRLGY